MNDCSACGLCDVAFNVNIPGRGREGQTGGVLVVAQQPGPQEDLAGRALVGPSGQLLEELLADAGFTVDEYRLTNSVRCVTPIVNRSRRAPTPAEVNACRVHLKAEIDAMRPDMIVALGDTALQSLTKKSGIKAKRGQTLPLHDDFGYACEVLPTYHSAAMIRTPTLRRTIVGDLIKARSGVEAPDHVPWSWWAGSVPAGDVLSYDIETDGLHGGEGAIVQVCISNGEQQVVARGLPDVWSALRALKASGALLVGHNSWVFDGPEIARQLRIALPYGDDTSALAYLDDETQSLGLEALAVKYLGVPGWKDGITAPLDSDEFAAYNARDSWYTWKLHAHLVALLGERYNIVRYIMRPMRKTLDVMSKRGLVIDPHEVEAARVKWSTERDRWEAVIASSAIVSVTNPRSGAQVGAALLAEGHSLPTTEKTGKPKTDIKTLEGLRRTPLVEGVIGFREAQTKLSSFCLPYAKLAAEGDGRAHATFSVWRTLTGRTNAKDRNVQNLDRELKSFFSAPPGYELAQFDFNAVEFWVAAFVANATAIMERKIANPNWDPHLYFASHVYEEEITDKSDPRRQECKPAQFGLLYIGTPETLIAYYAKQGRKITLDFARHLHKTFHTLYPEFDVMYRNVLAELEETSQSVTATGFIRHYGDFSLLRGPARLDALREAVNVKVQGLAAHIAFIGATACRRANLPVNGFFHDAVSFEFPAGTSQTYEHMVASLMCDTPVRVLKERFGVDFNRALLGVEMKVTPGLKGDE